MQTQHPFIYICTLLRSGATLIQESLTQKPVSYIFHEPTWAQGNFQNRDVVVSHLKEWVLDADYIFRHDNIAGILKDLTMVVPQIGIRENRNKGWEMYLNLFEDIKFVLVGRHPKDIYLACSQQLVRSDHWRPFFPPFGPFGLYREVFPEVQAQLQIAKEHEFMKIKYEDFCSDPQEFINLKAFVDSPVAGLGEIGDFHKRIKRGTYELGIHKSEVTTKRVFAHKEVTDEKLLSDMEDFYKFMEEYNEFWGY